MAVTGTQTIVSFDPTKVTLDPTATGATISSSGAFPDPTFTYSVNDNASVVSDPKTGLITVYVTKDPLASLGFSSSSVLWGQTGAEQYLDVG